MTIIGKDSTTRPCVATIGSFDGVHLGHQHVISQLIKMGNDRMLDTVAVSFSNHPLQVLHPEFNPQMLSTTEEKTDLLLKAGVDKVALLTFTKEMAAMSAEDFMKQVLHDSLKVKVLMIGYDNHFGHDRCGFDACMRYGKDMGIDVVSCTEWNNGSEVSSTAIRNSLAAGDIEGANRALGYRYALQGEVVPGFQNGRKIGFPTANIKTDPTKLIPEDGVYLVSVDVGERIMTGMMNIGTRPTLHNGSNRSLEVHILDFCENMYGKQLRVEFIKRLRKERKFSSVESLTDQLRKDEALCRLLAEDQTGIHNH